MKKHLKRILFLTLLLIPTIVFASEDDFSFSVAEAVGTELFVTIHMSIFVLWPISTMVSEKNYKQVFFILFILRTAFLAYFDIIGFTWIALVDFICVFIGAFLLVPLVAFITKKSPFSTGKTTTDAFEEEYDEEYDEDDEEDFSDDTFELSNDFRNVTFEDVSEDSSKDLPVEKRDFDHGKVERRCARCFELVGLTDKTCPKCGYELKKEHVMVIDKKNK